MNVRKTMREKEKAKKFWASLSTHDRNELGDAFVLDTFDWREWFHTKPSNVLLNEVDHLRILWECTT